MIGITNVVNKRKSEAERMNLTLKTNQSEHTDLLGVNFTLTYGTYTKSYTWSGSTITIEVPNGVEYTLTFPDVEGYACNTKSVTYTAQSGNSRMLEVLYQCELLTVNVSADNGESVIGQKVTINGITHTWNGKTITQKIAFGTSYFISADAKSGYTTPPSQSYSASQAERNCNIVYVYNPYGVFIQGISGTLYNETDWNNQETPNGVAIVTENCSFVVALEDAHSSSSWGGYGKSVSGVTTATSLSVAQEDYDGEVQTAKIISGLSGYYDGYATGAPAAEACSAYTFPNGKKGYLGALGEWQQLIYNKDAVVSAMNKCGGADLFNQYLTSTQYNKASIWYLYFYYSEFKTDKKSVQYKVRAFTTL